jgi:hypothetical protein
VPWCDVSDDSDLGRCVASFGNGLAVIVVKVEDMPNHVVKCRLKLRPLNDDLTD